MKSTEVEFKGIPVKFTESDVMDKNGKGCKQITCFTLKDVMNAYAYFLAQGYKMTIGNGMVATAFNRARFTFFMQKDVSEEQESPIEPSEKESVAVDPEVDEQNATMTFAELSTSEGYLEAVEGEDKNKLAEFASEFGITLKRNKSFANMIVQFESEFDKL